MSRYSFAPYVSVAERRLKAEQVAKKMAKGGRVLSPVRIEDRTIARTFWGKSWCTNLESYSDYENRLPRGRTYVRNGSVIDLNLDAGKITALVQGSSLYKIDIGISALPTIEWTKFTNRCAGKVTNLLDLLQGRISKEILKEISTPGTGLFPAPKEIKLSCTCPDWAEMCKHVAAVLYGVGARLDEKPELFFTLRGVDVQDLITSASASATTSLTGAPTGDTGIADSELSGIFGVELETAAVIPSHLPSEAKARTKVPSSKLTAVKAKKTPKRTPLKAKGSQRKLTKSKKPKKPSKK